MINLNARVEVCGVTGWGLGDSYQCAQYPICCSWDRYLLPCDHEVIRLELGSLSKHDSDGSENVIWKCNFVSAIGSSATTTTTPTKTPLICIFDNGKQYFCALCTCIFHLLTFWRRSRSFYDVKWPVLQLFGRRQHMMTNVQFCLLMPQALVPISFQDS